MKQSITLIVVLLVGIIVAFFITKKISDSLLLISQYAKNLPNSNFQHKKNLVLESIGSKSKNEEIKQLVSAFMFMESELDKNFNTMQDYQQNLKNLVKEQTQKLIKSNENLKLENEERKQAEKSLLVLNKTLDENVKKRTNDLKKLNEYLIITEEQERSTLATDLHDTVAQTLALSVSKIKNMKESDAVNNVEMLLEVQEFIEQSILEVRQLIYQLCPPIVKDFDIATVIEFLIEEINQKFYAEITFVNKLDNLIDIAELKKITLYRVANELIMNVLKHSGVKKAQVELSKKNNTVVLKIEDNGLGFDMAIINTNHCYSFGLYGLSERCKNMGGDVKIESTPGKGTKAIIFIPVS